MESYRKREVARVQKGRQKRRKELERLRRFYRYIEKTDPKKIRDFDNTESESSTIALQDNTDTIDFMLEEMCRTYNADTITLQDKTDTITLQDKTDTITLQDNTDTITLQDNTDTTDFMLEEMCHTYNVHLEEFDYNLFEGLYDEHLKI